MEATLTAPRETLPADSSGERTRKSATERQPWLVDRRLNVTVDVSTTPVVLRLSGTLDAGTGANLEPVVRELIDQGHRRFVIDVDGLEIDVPGGGGIVLTALGRLVLGAGATRAPLSVTNPHHRGPRSPSHRRSRASRASSRIEHRAPVRQPRGAHRRRAPVGPTR